MIILGSDFLQIFYGFKWNFKCLETCLQSAMDNFELKKKSIHLIKYFRLAVFNRTYGIIHVRMIFHADVYIILKRLGRPY